MLSNPSSSLACCAKKAALSYFFRPISKSVLLAEEAPLPRRKRNVIKKEYTELPTGRVLADGTLSPPLSEWIGGLGEPVVAYRNVPPSIRAHFQAVVGEAGQPSGNGAENGTDAAGVPLGEGSSTTPVKKVSKRRVKSRISEASQAMKDVAESAPTSKVRRGKTTKKTTQDAVMPLPASSLATEILENLNRYAHCILLTRVGQFYESYFDQAAEVSRLLNIKLTKKTWGGERVLMCGFPIMYLHKYLKILVQDHKRFVAMCEEFRRDRSCDAQGAFERRVTRIVTPGTLIDEPFLNPYENNFLLAVAHAKQGGSSTSLRPESPVGLAWIDVSTGEFYTKHTTLGGIRDEIVRISPKEVILDERLRGDDTSPVRTAAVEENCFVSYVLPFQSSLAPAANQMSADDLTAQLNASKEVLPDALTEEESVAIGLLTTFMQGHLMEHMPSLPSPNRELSSSRMQIDSHTLKALEIREGLREGGTTGSLLHVIKRTVTSSGTRLLARWLCSPSTSVAEINARQSLVAFFHGRPFLRQDLVLLLRDAEDATRIVQKFLVGRGSFSDLNAICTTVDIWSSIKERLFMEKHMEGSTVSDTEWFAIETLIRKFGDLTWLATRIRAALVPREINSTPEDENSLEDVPNSVTPGPGRDFRNPLGITNWTISSEFSEEFGSLHAKLRSLLAEKDQLERRLQVTFAAPTLTLRASPGLGMHVHVSRKAHASQLIKDVDFIALSESGSTCTFFHRGWSQLAAQISETTMAITVAEREAFEMLRDEVISQLEGVRRNARIIDELDVTLAFANLAIEMRFVRPVVNEGTSYHVVNGRHPTVEVGLLTSGRGFTPNTITFTPESQLQIITGPNMAGKSTLLRQTALIAILAQIGSHVPADSAEIGIVDRVFSRVGAKDDLFRDRSTFMVEMLEASDILRRATSNSLVIMDEVGRGTTVEDGLAIAFATVYHLLFVNGCRTMFATHFHELADMLSYDTESQHGHGAFSKVAFFCTNVDEVKDGFFAYSHRVKPGVNRDSHGLKVAQLAGMPEPAVEVARSAIAWLKKRSAARANHKLDLQTLGQKLVSGD